MNILTKYDECLESKPHTTWPEISLLCKLNAVPFQFLQLSYCIHHDNIAHCRCMMHKSSYKPWKKFCHVSQKRSNATYLEFDKCLSMAHKQAIIHLIIHKIKL